jgi:hypothetical protein
MAARETQYPIANYEQSLYAEMQAFIEFFRNQNGTSSPDDWMKYIDIMAASRDAIRISGFTIQELVPPPGDKSVSMIRILRRSEEECKAGKYCALLILHSNRKDISRLAIVKDDFNEGEYIVKKAIIHNDIVRTTNSNGVQLLFEEFDTLLKNYRTPGEIAHPSMYQ